MRFSDIKVGQTFVYRSIVYVRINDTIEQYGDTFNVVALTGVFSGHLDWFARSAEVKRETGYIPMSQGGGVMKLADLKEGDYFREKENHGGVIWCLVDGLDTHRDCSAAWPVSGDSPYWFDHDTEVVRMIPNYLFEEE